MIEITSDLIDTQSVIDAVSGRQSGAVVLFLGNTREFTAEQQTTHLSYECYEKMAIEKMQELKDEAISKWDLVDVAMIHRIGVVDPGQTSVAIATASEHRGPAFEAGKWLIDTLKTEVPIWKKEKWSDGSSEWIHPDQPTEDGRRPTGQQFS